MKQNDIMPTNDALALARKMLHPPEDECCGGHINPTDALLLAAEVVRQADIIRGMSEPHRITVECSECHQPWEPCHAALRSRIAELEAELGATKKDQE